MNESFGKQEMKGNVRKSEETIGQTTEEIKQIKIKVVPEESVSEETDKEFKKHLDFFALMDLREKRNIVEGCVVSKKKLVKISERITLLLASLQREEDGI